MVIGIESQDNQKRQKNEHSWSLFDFFTPCFALKSHSKFLNSQLHDHTCQASQYQICYNPTDHAQLTVRGKIVSFGYFFSKKTILWRRQWCDIFALLEDWKVYSCRQTQSCQVWSRSKKGLRISRSVFTDRFQINVLVVFSFFLLETRTQLFESPKTILPSFTDLTPGTTFSHKKLCFL